MAKRINLTTLSRLATITILASAAISSVPSFALTQTTTTVREIPTTRTSMNLHIDRVPDGRLSFDFQDISIRTLLQLIAKNADLNFIISDSVKGNITLSLHNVSWQRALDIILKSRGLTARRSANVVMISTIEDITSNESKQLQSEETLSNLAPLVSTIIHLRYASAADIANLLKGPQSQLLTTRGQVGVDSHTNSVIVRDTASNIAEVRRSIVDLDIPSKQVLIEARIVNIDVNFEKQIGARFGISKPSYLTGTFTGANSLAQGTQAPFVANPAGVIDPTQRLNFNNAAQTIFGNNPGSIGIAVAKVGGVLLDLELSALEGEQHAQLISSPRVITSNQQKAMIQTGEEIPYQESTSSGATSVSFKNAVLSLEITPQITPDNKIILALVATQDSRGTPTVLQSLNGAPSSSVPAINTQAVQSHVILNNNETIVLGGIYKQNTTHEYERIPFLGSLPIIGTLFRHTGDTDEKTELLIFITPKIINPLATKTMARKGEG